MCDDSDIERLYSPSQWSKRYNKEEVFQKHVQFLEEQSKLVRKNIPCELNIPYGPRKRDTYDIYGTDLKDESPILIHIHGGYYQEESVTHSNNGFISNNLYQNGIKTILLGYELAPHRTLKEILEHLKVGLKKCLEYAKKVKPRGIYLSGHSVGAHAIATLLTDFRRSIAPEDRVLIKSAFLLCGIYELEPLTRMSANEILKLSTQSALELSPNLSEVDFGNTIIYIVAAENDSPAFVEQSRKFYEKLKTDGVECFVNIVPLVDHFDIVEKLYYADFDLTKIIIKGINKTC